MPRSADGFERALATAMIDASAGLVVGNRVVWAATVDVDKGSSPAWAMPSAARIAPTVSPDARGAARDDVGKLPLHLDPVVEVGGLARRGSCHAERQRRRR